MAKRRHRLGDAPKGSDEVPPTAVALPDHLVSVNLLKVARGPSVTGCSEINVDLDRPHRHEAAKLLGVSLDAVRGADS